MKTNAHSEQRIVIHLIQSLDSGGCENMLLRTLPILSNKLEHRIVTLKEPGELAPKFRQKDISVMTIGEKSLLKLALGQKLIRFIQAQRPALVVTYLFHADVAGRLFLQSKLNVPVISFLRTTYNYRRYWPARVFERLTHKKAQYYLANSEAVKEYYVQRIGVSPRKITVIPNGIDVSVYDRVNRKQVESELKLPREHVVVTCVANLAPNKGHRYLLEAFELVYENHPETWLLCVGDGPQKAHLQQQIKAYQSKEHIKFLGRRSDVPALLGGTDIFVLPTLFEGMSNALLEAAASRCAIITTDIPENRACLASALFVPPCRSDVLAQAMNQLCDNPSYRIQLGETAKREVNTNYDLPLIASKFEDILLSYSD